MPLMSKLAILLLGELCVLVCINRICVGAHCCYTTSNDTHVSFSVPMNLPLENACHASCVHMQSNTFNSVQYVVRDDAVVDDEEVVKAVDCEYVLHCD